VLPSVIHGALPAIAQLHMDMGRRMVTEIHHYPSVIKALQDWQRSKNSAMVALSQDTYQQRWRVMRTASGRPAAPKAYRIEKVERWMAMMASTTQRRKFPHQAPVVRAAEQVADSEQQRHH